MEYAQNQLKESLRKVLGTLADLIVLNLLILVCCLPIFTIGAALTAGYTSLMRILRGVEQTIPIREFFKDFKQAFRTSTLSWLLVLLCSVIIAGDYVFAVIVSDPVNRFFLVFSLVMAFAVACVAVWLFPIIARYENNIPQHIKNAIKMAVGMFPRTLLAIILQLATILLPIMVPALFTYLGWFWILFGLSLPMFLTVKLFRIPLDCEPQGELENGQD